MKKLIIGIILGVILSNTATMHTDCNHYTVEDCYYYTDGTVKVPVGDEWHIWDCTAILITDVEPYNNMPVVVEFCDKGTENVFDDCVVEVTQR